MKRDARFWLGVLATTGVKVGENPTKETLHALTTLAALNLATSVPIVLRQDYWSVTHEGDDTFHTLLGRTLIRRRSGDLFALAPLPPKVAFLDCPLNSEWFGVE